MYLCSKRSTEGSSQRSELQCPNEEVLLKDAMPSPLINDVQGSSFTLIFIHIAVLNEQTNTNNYK